MLYRIGGFWCMSGIDRSNTKKKKTSSIKHKILKKNHIEILICNFIIEYFFPNNLYLYEVYKFLNKSKIQPKWTRKLENKGKVIKILNEPWKIKLLSILFYFLT
jgi:hypothetical protein